MSAPNAGTLENKLTLYDRLYPHPEESALKKIAYAPARGLKEWFRDSYHSFKEANIPKDANAKKQNGIVKILKGYGGSAVGGAAGMVATRGLQEIVAGATNTSIAGLNSYNFFDFKGLLSYSYPGAASAGVAGKAGVLATTMLPYLVPIALGTYIMAKGAKKKSLVTTGIGSGMVGIGAFNIAGDYAVAAKTLFSGILPAVGYTPVLLYGLAGALALGSYHLGKKLVKGVVKKMFGSNKAEEKHEEKKDAHAPPATPAEAHHLSAPNMYNLGDYNGYNPKMKYRNAA